MTSNFALTLMMRIDIQVRQKHAGEKLGMKDL